MTKRARPEQVHVGIIVGDLANPFFTSLATVISATLAAGSAGAFITDCRGDLEEQQRIADDMVASGFQGLILTVPHNPAVLRMGTIPVVAVDRCEGAPYVSLDNVLGGRMVARHLMEKGYQNLAIITGDPSISSAADRYAGFRTTLTGAGRDLPEERQAVCQSLEYEEAHELAVQLLDAGADAIFGINDLLGAGAMAAATDGGLTVPGDVGVVGFDNTPMSAWPAMSMTSVAQDTDTLGKAAAEMVLTRIKKPDEALAPQVFPPRLVARRSTQRPR